MNTLQFLIFSFILHFICYQRADGFRSSIAWHRRRLKKLQNSPQSSDIPLEINDEFVSIVKNFALKNFEELKRAGYNITETKANPDREIQLEEIPKVINSDEPEGTDGQRFLEIIDLTNPPPDDDIIDLEENELIDKFVYDADIFSLFSSNQELLSKGIDKKFITSLTKSHQERSPKEQQMHTTRDWYLQNNSKPSHTENNPSIILPDVTTFPSALAPEDHQFKQILQDSLQEVMRKDANYTKKELVTSTYLLLQQLSTTPSTTSTEHQKSPITSSQEAVTKALFGETLVSIAELLQLNLTKEILEDSSIQQTIQEVLKLPENMTLEQFLPEEEDVLASLQQKEEQFQQAYQTLEADFSENMKGLQQQEESELAILLQKQEELRRTSDYLKQQILSSQQLMTKIQQRPDLSTYLVTLALRPREQIIAFIVGWTCSLKWISDLLSIFVTKREWMLMELQDWWVVGFEAITALLAFYYADFLAAIFRTPEEGKEIMK